MRSLTASRRSSESGAEAAERKLADIENRYQIMLSYAKQTLEPDTQSAKQTARWKQNNTELKEKDKWK